ncbi:MAG: CotH kinase family protein [Verrucomicrobiales bacterium]
MFRKSFDLALILSALIGSAALAPAAVAGVVINEIMYNAPNDLDELEFVELLNSGTDAVDISGWQLSKGISYTFAEGTVMRPGGFLVICRTEELFAKFYPDIEPCGAFEKSLSNSSDKINLKSADGGTIDSIEYQDRAPWPVSADGYTASLERICPAAPSQLAANWAPSVLSTDDDRKPSGSPGKANSVFAKSLPPVVSQLSPQTSPAIPPGSTPLIHATVSNAADVALLFRTVEPGGTGQETRLPMQKKAGDQYVATLPAQDANRIVRYRVQATGADGAVRFYPHENEARPAFSAYFSTPIEKGKIPVAQFFNIGEEAFKRAEEYRTNTQRSGSGLRGGGFGDFRGRPDITEADVARMDAARMLSDRWLSKVWISLTLESALPDDKRNQLRPAFQKANTALADLREELSKSRDPQDFAKGLSAKTGELRMVLERAATPLLDSTQTQLLTGIGARQEFPGPGFGELLQRIFDIDSAWFRASMNAEIDDAMLDQVHAIYTAARKSRDAIEIPDGGDGPDFGAIIGKVEEQRAALEEALAADIGEKRIAALGLAPENPFRDFGGGRGLGGPGFRGDDDSDSALPVHGQSAFIYTDPVTGQSQLFDFVNITPRKSGYKVRLHKDQALNGMTSINVLYEPGEETILNEALAYDLYRAAGNASQRAGYMRLVMDGHLVGHHLWFEQPNGAFFRHNDIDDDGNLYKVIWQGGSEPSEFTPDDKMPTRRDDVVGRHEKKSNPHDGYEDLIDLVEALDSESDEEPMWKLIQQRFDVEQVVNYFAVNSLISHWDGFFNNYFLYHDTKRDKWSIYPWDQDSTWSQRGGNPEELYRMPLNFGAEGAVPPGSEQSDGRRGRGGRRGGFGGGFGRGGFGWWRDGGEISRPLLANPQFHARFLARLKELTDTIFTERAFGKNIDVLEQSLLDEVKLRAEANSQNPEAAVEAFRSTITSLKQHLSERRKFLQEELRKSK